MSVLAPGSSASRSPPATFLPPLRLKRKGVDLLPIPENYYSDLEVRLDLDAPQIERLRAGNILYDRDGETEYFQIYTTALESGLFFEIVERRGYAGFGAANTPIRLAAQTRLAQMTPN